MKLLGISGSLRKDSFNTNLLRAAQKALPEGVSMEITTLHGIPLYDGDLEAAEGSPAAVEALKAAIMAADGVILATPEYNGGMPGVFKNALDWASRPADARAKVFVGRPFAIMGASPSGFGTIVAQQNWLPVMRALGVNLWTQGSLAQSRAHLAYDAEGNLTDAQAQKMLAGFVSGFVDYVKAAR